MDNPKILPWMARKANISDALTHSLWRRAAAEASLVTGQRSGHAFSQTALMRLEALIEKESQQLHPFGRQPTAGWFWPQQRRLAAQMADMATALSRVRWLPDTIQRTHL